MEEYYKRRPGRSSVIPSTAENEETETVLSEYDQYRQSLVNEDDDEGWNSEYRRYLKDRPANVKKDTDIIQWWQVCSFQSEISCQYNLYYLKEHAQLYPTLARMALDILPCQASSVPCERLFSASKQTAENRRASLGENRFEELQVMKFAWRPKIEKAAGRNSEQIEEVDLDDIDEYTEMLVVDESAAEFDRIEDEVVLLDY
jgi:hypothetical protein